jgi:hypothetical protein
MIKLSDNIKNLPNIDIYLIQKYHNIKIDSPFVKTYDLIIEKFNNKDDDITKIINFKDLNKKNYNNVYDFLLDYKQIYKENIIIINNEKNKKLKYKKKKISATLKRLVWNKWIGEEIGKSKCLCCNVTDINQMSFNCGHIIAECKGGETILSNLKPICQNCNSSMASMNMNDFMKTFE